MRASQICNKVQNFSCVQVLRWGTLPALRAASSYNALKHAEEEGTGGGRNIGTQKKSIVNVRTTSKL